MKEKAVKEQLAFTGERNLRAGALHMLPIKMSQRDSLACLYVNASSASGIHQNQKIFLISKIIQSFDTQYSLVIIFAIIMY